MYLKFAIATIILGAYSSSFAIPSVGVFSYLEMQEPVKVKLLALDNNHDGIVSSETIANGQDAFLLAHKPAQMLKTNTLVQDHAGNLFEPASVDDLQASANVHFVAATFNHAGKLQKVNAALLNYSVVKESLDSTGQAQYWAAPAEGKVDLLRPVDFELPSALDPQLLEPAKISEF